jgi:hypothetical protein
MAKVKDSFSLSQQLCHQDWVEKPQLGAAILDNLRWNPATKRIPNAAALSAPELVCQPIPRSASLLHADHADRDQ